MNEQSNYKKLLGKREKRAVHASSGQFFFLYKASKATQSAAEMLAEVPRKKLLLRAVRPSKVLASTPETVTIDENGQANTVKIDRVSLSPPPDGIERHVHFDPTQTRADHTTNSSQPESTRTGNKPPTHDQEYAIVRIVGQRNHKKGTKYRVRWNGYNKNDDMFDPRKHIAEHFIVRYWKVKCHWKWSQTTTLDFVEFTCINRLPMYRLLQFSY